MKILIGLGIFQLFPRKRSNPPRFANRRATRASASRRPLFWIARMNGIPATLAAELGKVESWAPQTSIFADHSTIADLQLAFHLIATNLDQAESLSTS
jgi:hypothetical protein